MLLSICIAFKLISDMDASLTKEDIMATIKLGHTDTTVGIPKGGAEPRGKAAVNSVVVIP